MTTDAERVFEIEDGRSPTQILDAIAAAFPGVRTGPTPLRRTYGDTFDRRLVRAGAALAVCAPDGLRWTERTDARPSWLPGHGLPAFARDLPDGLLRDELLGRTDGRRLLPTTRIDGRTRGLDVRDADDKTVARVRIDERSVCDGARRRALPTVLRILPVRGYEPQAGRLVEFARLVLDLAPTDRPEYAEALSAFGEAPDADPSKPRIALDPSMRAGEAVREVLAAHLRVIEAHAPGVREDLDTEFLHDLRVAVRQTRSVLGQLREVLAEDDVERFAEAFRWLGTESGPTRDLDVLLEAWDEAVPALEAPVREALGPARDRLARARARAQAALARALASRRFSALVGDWRAFLEGDGPDGPRARAPALEVVSPAIRRAHKRVVRKARGLDAHAPPETVHAARIAAKKLRYLLAGFRSLYEVQDVDACVAALKQLQTTLGTFNDTCVFEARLLALADELGAAGAPPRTLVALGRLLAHFDRVRATEREHLAAHVALLLADDVRRTYKRLCGKRAS